MTDFDLLYKRTRVTSMTRTELEQAAYREGMGTYHDVSSFNTEIFNCEFSGETFRTIGAIYYSPSYMEKRGGMWRISIRKDASTSDVCVLLETLIPLMNAGESSTYAWDQRNFTNAPGWFRNRRVCRPLSDYDGEELAAMVTLPEGLETIAFETRSSDVGVQL